MQFLADVELVCEECKGTRFKQQILDVRYRGKNMHEVLNMTVREAITFFRDVRRSRIACACWMRSDWVICGSANQRRRCPAARRSASNSRRIFRNAPARKTLYIFDEPTTGLHFDDINKLLAAFRALIEAGGSLLVIEHNLDVIKTADYIIDLGPGRRRRRRARCGDRNAGTDHEGEELVYRQVSERTPEALERKCFGSLVFQSPSSM